MDNARIEIEGGSEIPIVDGSALGWCIEIQQAGLRPAGAPAAPPPAAAAAGEDAEGGEGQEEGEAEAAAVADYKKAERTAPAPLQVLCPLYGGHCRAVLYVFHCVETVCICW